MLSFTLKRLHHWSRRGSLVVHEGFTVNDGMPFKTINCMKLSAWASLLWSLWADLGVSLTRGMHFCPVSVAVNHSCCSLFMRDLAKHLFPVFSVTGIGNSDRGSHFWAFIAGQFPPWGENREPERNEMGAKQHRQSSEEICKGGNLLSPWAGRRRAGQRVAQKKSSAGFDSRWPEGTRP